MLGFPIRTPSDHSSVDSSPRPIAASHVLHRLLMPRHPPCALKHLITTRCSHPLCNTQHTTTSPNPPRPPPPHHPLGVHSVRRSGPGAARKEPNLGCLLRTQQCAKPYKFVRKLVCMFHPATPTGTHPPNGDPAGCSRMCTFVKGEPRHLQSARSAPPHGETP